MLDMLARNPADARSKAKKSAAPSTNEAETRRAKFIEGIDATLEQIGKGEENPKRGWYVVTTGGVNVRPKVGRKVMRIYASGEKGDLFDFIPSDEPLQAAKTFFTQLRENAEAQKIDTWLLATLNGDSVPKKQGGKPRMDDD